LNDHGHVVGAYVDAAGAMHGFVLSKGQFQSIDDPFGVGTTLVNGINDFGALVGFYVDAAGNTNGFLAIPKDSGGPLVGANGQRITLQTEAPLPGSPVLAAGIVSAIPPGVTTDQRGLPRVVDGTVDIGAVEIQGAPRGEQLEHAREGAHAARDWVFALGDLVEGYLRPRHDGFSNT
jgi:hypothetical protein